MIKAPKKLIEVALPLDDINKASAKEKSIRHGHPSTLHLWWARRPLATARAVLFAQLVNDPGGERGWGKYHGQTKEDAHRERERLFDILRKLVKWENTDNKEILKLARKEIKRSWEETCELNGKTVDFDPELIPAFHDPFAGGGSIPLEAQRLGLKAYASDLNPIAVIINKAMIELPSIFVNRPPINPITREKMHLIDSQWEGLRGIVEDILYYGNWMRDEAYRRIGQFYPKVRITKDMATSRSDIKELVGHEFTIIAWLWARTIKSSNPAFSDVYVPLVSTFILSSKKGKEVWIKPVVEGERYSFTIQTGKPPADSKKGTKLGRGARFKCILSNTIMSKEYVRGEFQAKRDKKALIAVVIETNKGRKYLPASQEMVNLAESAHPKSLPPHKMNQKSKDLVSGRGYGFEFWHELFTPRQLLALNTLTDLVTITRDKVILDAKSSGLADDGIGVDKGGNNATAYGDTVALYLALAISKLADAQSSFVRWKPSMDQAIATFGRQAIPMVWDFAESNVFNKKAGDFIVTLNNMMRVLKKSLACGFGHASQHNASEQTISENKIVSTDPPYYDNVGYADLSDFFYIWLRKSLRPIFPDLFTTIGTPKTEELVAIPYRHGNKTNAENFFTRLSRKPKLAFSLTGSVKRLC